VHLAASQILIASLVLAALSCGCGNGGPQKYGTPIGSVAVVPISDLLSSPEIYLGKDVGVRGMVVQVCQEMGCWFEITESGRRLMIDLEMGRRFTVPRGIVGYTARVEGRFVRDNGVLKIIGGGVELKPPAGT